MPKTMTLAQPWLQHQEALRLRTSSGFRRIKFLRHPSRIFLPAHSPWVTCSKLHQAWPGVWPWLKVIYQAPTHPNASAMQKGSAINTIGSVLYMFAHDIDLQKVVVATPGSLELATQVWLLEDTGAAAALVDLPPGTLALGNLLQFARKEELDRATAAANGKLEEIAKFALKRLRSELTAKPLHDERLNIHMDFVNSICRVPMHPLRNAFLANGAINLIVKVLVAVSNNPLANEDRILVITSGFGFLHNVLESLDGCSLVKQAVRAGLLSTFVDCSPAFVQLDKRDQHFALDVLRKIVSRYLIYATVIDTVNTALEKVASIGSSSKVNNTPARDVWISFRARAAERKHILEKEHASHSVATCDNVQVRIFNVYFE